MATTTTDSVIHLDGHAEFTDWHELMRQVHAAVLANERPDTAIIFEPASLHSLGRHYVL